MPRGGKFNGAGRGRGRGGGGGHHHHHGGRRGGNVRGGRGGRGGAVTKPYNDKFKKFKSLQRNQEAEESLRQRRQMESNQQVQQQKQQQFKQDDLESSSDEDEVNAFDQLVSSLSGGAGGADSKASAIESSDSSDDAEDEEDNSEMDAEEEEDADDFEINEQFEEQVKRPKFADDDNDIEAKAASPTTAADAKTNDADEDEEEDSSDEDENQILRPEESSKATKTSTKDYVILDSNDESETEVDDDDDEENQLEINKTDGKSIVDMFSTHFDNEISPDMLESLSTKPTVHKHELNWPHLGRIQVEIPTTTINNDDDDDKPKKRILLEADVTYATEGMAPHRFDHKNFNLTDAGIKSQMHPHVSTANAANRTGTDAESTLTNFQAELFSIMNNYQDLYCPSRTHANGEQIRFAYCLHAANHILKTRTRILHHNAKIARDPSNPIVPDAYRDQGLFRPKVLIVVPFRESALRIVRNLIALLFPDMGAKVMHYNRFVDEFAGETLYFPQRNPKPEDYEQTFAGNSDDTFRIGVCITRKCIKLYSDFYTSDILIVSPLGLRMIVGAPGEKDRDYDFMASIEMLIIDQADLFVAQNWDHLLHVLDHLHLQPQSARNSDFSRVRSWCLNGWTRFYRQTLMFASHELPEFRALFGSRCSNYRGKCRVANPIRTGTIRHVAVQVPQLFHRVDATSIQSSFDQRFNHFTQKILPQYKGASMAHCLIFVPSYFDFVRLRNYFKKESLNFVQICEYTKDGKIARSRDMFFHSGAHFLLYSERAHFFRRTRIKGIRHLIMYQPPTWPNFYSEMVNLMQETYQNPRDGGAGSMTVTMLYTKYDMLQIASIIGSDRAAKMAAADKPTHMFMTGGGGGGDED